MLRQPGKPLVVVDYAHSPDALQKVLETLRSLLDEGARLICVFGCGGDRDAGKRPLMGEVATRLAHEAIVTSDNPRSEDPLTIINDAMVGVRRTETPHIVEPDRAAAIRKAIDEAGSGDIVILAGKGHETYQILGGQTIHFDDREVAREVLHSYGFSAQEPRG
jgi:UDP-N-acetylmuramoyl-L-alanyl-D-glutamate--2,6-diaminopimelate ligase